MTRELRVLAIENYWALEIFDAVGVDLDAAGGPRLGSRALGLERQRLESIKVPALIVLGDTDFTPVEHAARMATLAGAQLAVLPDTTHLSIMSRPDWLVPLIEHRMTSALDQGD